MNKGIVLLWVCNDCGKAIESLHQKQLDWNIENHKKTHEGEGK